MNAFPKTNYGTIKPSGQPIIDINSPLSFGLTRMWMLDGQKLTNDLITGETSSQVGTISSSVGYQGKAAYFQGQNNAKTNYYTVHTGAILGGSASWSIVAGTQLLAAHSGNNAEAYAIYCERAASGNDILKLEVGKQANQTQIVQVYRNDAATLIQNIGGSNLNDGKFHVLACTKNGSGSNNAIVYVDGVSKATASWNTNDTFTNAGLTSTIGADIADNGSGWPDYISFVALYKRALTQQEVLLWSYAPYSVLLFPQDRIWAAIQAKQFQAAWAIPANFPQQGYAS